MSSAIASSRTSFARSFALGINALLVVWFAAIPVEAATGTKRSTDAFANPIAEGADPWVIRHGEFYYWCQSEEDRGVAIWRSERLTDLGEKHVVWRAPDSGPYSDQVWAPELHFLDGRWYIYVAASDGSNEHHRTIVLESPGDDPLANYHFKAELYTGDSLETGRDNRWAIDATVLEQGGRRYCLWSGWEDARDEQWLYIAPMTNPWTIGANRVRLCDNDDYLWERVSESPNERGLNEAPQVLTRANRVFVVYSCSGSWEPTYKLGMLELKSGGDPLKSADWMKPREPVFESTRDTFGVGHCSFTSSPDATEHWIAYHAKVERRPGWRREIFVQPFRWTLEGRPAFGRPVSRERSIPAAVRTDLTSASPQ